MSPPGRPWKGFKICRHPEVPITVVGTALRTTLGSAGEYQPVLVLSIDLITRAHCPQSVRNRVRKFGLFPFPCEHIASKADVEAVGGQWEDIAGAQPLGQELMLSVVPQLGISSREVPNNAA